MRLSSRLAALVLLGATALPGGGGCEPAGREHYRSCLSQFYQLSDLLREARAEGALEPFEGRRFLTQLESCIADDSDLRVFCCARDPDAPPEWQDRQNLYCSYCGPTAAAARRFIRGEIGLPFVIACDGFGERRQDGVFRSVIVLWSTGAVEGIPLQDVLGYGGPGFRIGPDCPDPRFRDLAW